MRLWKQSALKYADFVAWLTEEGPYTVQYCRKVVHVARVFRDEAEPVAIHLGIDTAYEVIRFCEITGLDAYQVARTNAVIAGRPVAQHTRKSMNQAVQRALLEPVDDGVPDEPDANDGDEIARPASVPVSGEKMKEADGIARRVRSLALQEGADEVDTLGRPIKGRPWVYVGTPADQCLLLFD